MRRRGMGVRWRWRRSAEAVHGRSGGGRHPRAYSGFALALALLALFGFLGSHGATGASHPRADHVIVSPGRPRPVPPTPRRPPDPFKNPAVRARLLGAATARRRREAQLRSPAAQRRRVRSRIAYRRLSGVAALRIAQAVFSTVLSNRPHSPLRLRRGERVLRYVGDHGAVIRTAKGRRLFAESTAPLRARVATARATPLDLGLIDRGGALSPQNPAVDTRIPRRISDSVSFPAENYGFRLEGAKPAQATEVSGKTFYANATADTDVTSM